MKPARLLLLTAFALAFATTQGNAETWPARPLRVIVPVGAGSTTDIVPRVVFEQLTQQLGRPIVVENRTGAGGTIGAAAVAKSDADGYGVDPMLMSPKQFDVFIEKEIAANSDLVKAAGMKPN